DHAMRLSFGQSLLQRLGVEADAVERNRAAKQFEAVCFACVGPGPPVFGVPSAGGVSQLASSVAEHPSARIAEQSFVLAERDVDGRTRIDLFNHSTASTVDYTCLNWQPSTKKSKKRG